MLETNNLTKKDIGRYVYYIPKECLPLIAKNLLLNKKFYSMEIGRIKSWDDECVFVVYSKYKSVLNKFKNHTAARTYPVSLFFIDEKEADFYLF